MLRIRMLPSLHWFENEESGIKRVVEAYYKYLPMFDIEIVEEREAPVDLVVSHAGTVKNPDIVHTHGLYWSADYNCTRYEIATNAKVIMAARHAKEVTVPSKWVQKVFQRDMRFSPTVIPHGIEADEWEHEFEHERYVLWNKNRDRDVCTPEHITPLAKTHQDVSFVTTFAPSESLNNVQEIGIVPHNEMKELVQKAGVYLSTTKETFGIGILEAMAAGVPVLGFDFGGNSEIIEHGITGYLAQPGNYDDLRSGLNYCMKNRSILGENGKEIVKKYTWEKACEIVSEVYHRAANPRAPSVSVIIPTYNYGDKVDRAIKSAVKQEFEPEEIVVVDDGSTDNTEQMMSSIVKNHQKKQTEDLEYNQKTKIKYIKQKNSGVAIARNTGVEAANTKYVCCLDADDKIAPEFLDVCVKALEKDDSLGIAYTGLYYIKPDGEEGLSPWPKKWNFDDQLKRKNQVPTCNVMRKEMFDRLGGYRQRYAPSGAGSEDAEFWLRSGAYGWKAEKVDNRGLFIYSWLSGRVSGNPDYHEVDWLAWHPWVKDEYHPFASYASPKNKISHPVRQYDEPVISVIIPVGPGHENTLADALDSLEAQTFRKWEVILVFDGAKNIDYYKKVYPYATFVESDQSDPQGAGWARNKGVEHAKASMILFLDADDWIFPTALDRMLFEWSDKEGIIYSDYVSKGKMSEEESESFGSRLMDYNKKKEIGLVSFKSMDFDCERAQMQPKNPDKPYIWNLITSLLPKSYHEEIGGFDEKMESWEDWDYWIRMAKAGKCFYRVQENLVVYRFYTGRRRARGREISSDLIQYLKEKYKGTEDMGCNCKKLAERTANKRLNVSSSGTISYRSENEMDDKDFVLVRYDHPNRGQHRVYGPVTNRFYGYHGGGAEFYADKRDVASNPNLFVQITKGNPVPQKEPKKPDPPQPVKKESVTAPTDQPAPSRAPVSGKLTDIPGVSERIASEMNAIGIHSYKDIVDHKPVDLMTIKGVGESTATKIFEYVLMRQ